MPLLDHFRPPVSELEQWNSFHSNWATRIAERATGLMEPLRLIEADVKQGKAILRSDSPAKRDGKALYYELLLNRTDRSSATLRRYAGQPGEPRETMPFVLTHDAIVKLANDIVG